MVCDMPPTTVQNMAFYDAKDRVLYSKMPCFIIRKTANEKANANACKIDES